MLDFACHLLSLPILSVRQPWASYLVSGVKTIELRTWVSSYQGWLWIHAGKRPDLLAMKLLELQGEDFRCGGLLGLAKLESCRLISTEQQWLALRGDHLSPGYFSGQCYGWQFADALSLDEMIECRGELGLFKLQEPARQRVYEQFMRNSHQEFVRCAQDLVSRSLNVLPAFDQRTSHPGKT